MERRLANRIRRRGPIRFSEVVEAALYDAADGFYATLGRAGRRGDFLTSPEVGPLFGAVLARALDRWWDDLGRPDPYTVVEAGAGMGTLARSIVTAGPRCLGALRYVLVERSERLRAGQPEEFVARGELTGVEGPAVVLANELLDNLPFDLAQRLEGRWHEVRVGVDDLGGLVEVFAPATEDDVTLFADLAPDAPDGGRVPVQRAAAGWLHDALATGASRVVVIDYVDTTPSMAGRPWTDWVRTYRGHQRGEHPLATLGTQDITVEVAVDQLATVRAPDLMRTQAEFLAAHGLGALVEEGRRTWAERAHLGDLAAVKGRSRIGEAAALTDPAGLGSFKVIEWAGSGPS